MAQPPNNTRMNGLIDLARRDGIDIKPTLLRVLTDLYVQSPTHTADEEAQFIELACRLLAFADAETRAIVASRLRAYPRAPLAVLKVLATDAAPSHLEAMTASESENTPSPDIGQDETAHAEFKTEPPSAVPQPQADADEAEMAALFGGAPPDTHDLAEQFFRADRDERIAILHNLEFAPLEPALVPSGPRVSDAFERMEKAALAGRKISMTAELGALLHLSRSISDRIVQDPGGEALACALRAAGMPTKIYQRVLMFLDPRIGQSVPQVFALDKLYREMTPRAAQIMLAIWRGASARTSGARHQSMLQDDAGRVRNAQSASSQTPLARPAEKTATGS